ncbi:hypothetical protein ACFWFF_04585 [Streptomyces sp. NPDC060223]
MDDVFDLLFEPLIFRRLTSHHDLREEHAELAWRLRVGCLTLAGVISR